VKMTFTSKSIRQAILLCDPSIALNWYEIAKKKSTDADKTISTSKNDHYVWYLKFMFYRTIMRRDNIYRWNSFFPEAIRRNNIHFIDLYDSWYKEAISQQNWSAVATLDEGKRRKERNQKEFTEDELIYQNYLIKVQFQKIIIACPALHTYLSIFNVLLFGNMY
jgi:hypothetical protein